jgi:hypothetical protein
MAFSTASGDFYSGNTRAESNNAKEGAIRLMCEFVERKIAMNDSVWESISTTWHKV